MARLSGFKAELFVGCLAYLTSLSIPGVSGQLCDESAPGFFRAAPSSFVTTGARPRGVAVDSDRQVVYVAEEGTDSLRAMTSSGETLWTRPVTQPWGVAVARNTGRVFVSSYGDRTVQAYDPDGTQLQTIGQTGTKNYGEPGFFNGPTGLAITNDLLVVADPENNRWQIFSTDGAFLSLHGKKGFGPAEFGGLRPGPYGVGLDEPTLQLYFADPALHRVSRWTLAPDGSDARFEAAFGEAGREPRQLWAPFAVTVDPGNGDVYVMSTNNFRVEVFSGCGASRGTIGSPDLRSLSVCNASPLGQTLLGSPRLDASEYSSFSPARTTVGLRFQVAAQGVATGVRFVKPSGDVEQHTVRLWDTSRRALLYRELVQVDGCNAGEWVSLTLTQPVALSPQRTYALTLDNLGAYAAVDNRFADALPRTDLRITAATAGLVGPSPNNDLTLVGSATNYWVDVDFVRLADYQPPPVRGPFFGYSYGLAFAVPSDGRVYVADASRGGVHVYDLNDGEPEPRPIDLPPFDALEGLRCGTFPGGEVQTLFAPTDVPASVDQTDAQRTVIGQRFTAATDGEIRGVRWFKATSEPSIGHSGRVYEASSGQLLASTGAFVDLCSGPQWVAADLSPPLIIQGGVEYVVALDSVLFYAKMEGAMTEAMVSGDLLAPQEGGVFGLQPGVAPSESGGGATYFVDVEFVSFGGPPVAPVPPPGLRPLPVQPIEAACDRFPPPPVQTFFSPGERPLELAATVGVRVVVGNRLRTAVDGLITAIRYYKAAGERGTGTSGRVYNTVSGLLLASTVSFTDAACPGPAWVSVPLSKPLRTTAGVQYTVAVEGLLSFVRSENDLTRPRQVGDLIVTAGGGAISTDLGVIPRQRDGLPSNTNYWIDVEFEPGAQDVAPPGAPGRPPSSAPVPVSGLLCNTWPGAGVQTLYTQEDVPEQLSATDNRRLVLGHEIALSTRGVVTAVRYFKAQGEAGLGRTARIYDTATGRLLASTILINDGGCPGPAWISAPLSPALVVQPGVVYTVAVDGVFRYTKTDGYLAGGDRGSGDLTLLANGAVFGAPDGGMPSQRSGDTAQSSYFIDVEFRGDGRRRVLSGSMRAADPGLGGGGRRRVDGGWLTELNALNLDRIKASTHFTLNELKQLRTRFVSIANPSTGRVTKEIFCEQPEVCLNPFVHRLVDLILDPRRKNNILNPVDEGDMESTMREEKHFKSSRRLGGRTRKVGLEIDDVYDAGQGPDLASDVFGSAAGPSYQTISQGMDFLQFIYLLSPLHPLAPTRSKLQLLEAALDFNDDKTMDVREVCLILKLFFTSRLPDRRVRMIAEEMLEVLQEITGEGELDVKLLTNLLGQMDIDNRLTAYF